MFKIGVSADPWTGNIMTGLWKYDAIWNNRSTHAPLGNGLALNSSHCHADSRSDRQSMTTILQRLYWLPMKILYDICKVYEKSYIDMNMCSGYQWDFY